MTASVGRRQRVIDLLEAGKPEGTCPECGPHGNRGWVDLSVWRRHIVPCLECLDRAVGTADYVATDVARGICVEVEAEGCEVLYADIETHLEPISDHPWARRVTVVVPYRHARQPEIAIVKTSGALVLGVP